jgi:hypothetical protein
VSKSLDTVDHYDGNIVLIFPEQFIIRFNIDLFETESITASGVLDYGLRFVAEVTTGT